MKDDVTKGAIQSLNDLDRTIHEPARLMLMAFLYVVEAGDYTYLMSETGLTWGNLSGHLNKLEEAGYVEIEKGYKGKKPNTMARLTPTGRTAFQAYRQSLKQALDNLPASS
jgi:DNA-binding MarR family transcriptional regulator